ncbi:MAG: glycosyltransferase family 2 protein [Nitrospirae bacterium]|nr:glycosyltransferase family 2 protein [Nitrospirota bacterium]
MVIDNVSVVITTLNRSDIVGRAINSVLSQTFENIEVIVVIDGPDERTEKALEQINDPRFRVLALPENAGVSEARNSGVRAAKYDWIAFLDDDDEWLPEKLEKQANAAIPLDKALPVISCLYYSRSATVELTLPRKSPKPSEHISDYLFTKNSFFSGVAYLLPSTLLIKKELLEAVPFRRHIRSQDLDFLLRAAQLEEFCFEVVQYPLIIYHVLEQGQRLSQRDNAGKSIVWIRNNYHLFTHRAYVGYVAKNLSTEARRQNSWKFFVPLLREMFRFGRPKWVEFAIFLCTWFVPEGVLLLAKKIIGKKGAITHVNKGNSYMGSIL